MHKLSKALWVAFLLLLPVLAFAQGERGALTGVVMDPTGALVPEATITITEVRTGVVTTVASSSAGYYRVSVPPGTYRLEAKKEGFKTAVAENIVVPVAQVVNIDFTLQMGNIAESVTVTSEAPLLTTATSEVGNAISPQEFATLPIPVDDGGRQLMTFIFTSLPGTVGDTWTNSINGGSLFTTDIMIEGLPVARYDLQGSISEATPSADAANEFKVQMSSYSAEYGATAGGIANFGMKSGTNEFHGSVYEYFKNPVLNATGWNVNQLAPTTAGGMPNPAKVKAQVRENNFGFVLGGPIKKNRTFFFFNFEGDRRRAASPSRYTTIPTQKMVQGNFSEWLWNQAGTDALGRPVYWYEIYDPTSTRLVPAGDTDPVTGLVNTTEDDALIRDGFGFDPVTGLPGPNANVIPSSYVSVAADKLLPEFPTTINSQLGNNFVGYSGHPRLDINKWSLKIDHALTDKHKLAGFWTYSARKRLMGPSGMYWLPLPGYPLNMTKIQEIPFRLFRMSEDWTINDHTLNHLSIGYNRFGNFNGQPAEDPTPWLPSALGITGLPDVKIPRFNMASFSAPAGHPAAGKANLLSYFGSWQTGISFNANESYIYSDTLSYVRGKHSFKFGAEYRRYRMNERDQEGYSFNFSYLQTSLPGTYQKKTGHPFASFILGATNGGSRAVIGTNPGYRGGLFSLYGQDDWKVTPKLTVNYGLRWELPVPQTEAYDRISGLDPTVPNPGADGYPGALVFLGNCTGCIGGRSFQKYYGRQFAPRIGFAYSATQKLVIRGGYGISYHPPINNGWPSAAAGYNSSVNFGSTSRYPREFRNSADPAIFWTQLSGAPLPQWYIDNGRVGVPPFTGTLPDRSPDGMNYDTVEFHPASLALPYVQNWNFGFQYMLPADILVEADYTGTKGNRLFMADSFRNGANQPLTEYLGLNEYGSYLQDDIDEDLADPDRAAVLALFGITAKPFPSFSGSVAQALRPFPQYAGITNTFPNAGSSIYHSLQATVRKRAGHGLNFIAAYTWSKNLANTDSAVYWYGGYYWQDFYNRRNERSITSFDYRHYLKLTWIYDLPFGRGKKWLNSSGALDRIVGGWRVTAIHAYRSGNPLQVYNGDIETGFGQWGVRADVIPGVDQKVAWQGPVNSIDGTQYLNPEAFGSPPLDPEWEYLATRWGTASRFLPYTRGPGFQSEDVGILKDTKITERFILRFRADFFNFLNRTGRGDPDTNVASDSFGKIFGVAQGPRNIMLSLRLDF
jgi:hypothetical protein